MNFSHFPPNIPVNKWLIHDYTMEEIHMGGFRNLLKGTEPRELGDGRPQLVSRSKAPVGAWEAKSLGS